MSIEGMKALARKRARKDEEGKYPEMPDPQSRSSGPKIPDPVDRSYRQHSTADAVKGRNERRMGHGSVDVTVGEPELEETNPDPYVEMTAPNDVSLRKTDTRKEGAYPDMPEPKDNGNKPVQRQKFMMLRKVLAHMDEMDKE